jgi:predicted nucleic acid-binding protein
LDASTIVEALLRPDVSVRLAREIGDTMTVAPELVDVEVLSGLRRAVRDETATEDDARAAIEDFLSTPLERLPHRPFLRHAWELRDNLTVGDAVYVAVARALDGRLITADRRLAAAPDLGVTVTVLPS